MSMDLCLSVAVSVPGLSKEAAVVRPDVCLVQGSLAVCEAGINGLRVLHNGTFRVLGLDRVEGILEAGEYPCRNLEVVGRSRNIAMNDDALGELVKAQETYRKGVLEIESRHKLAQESLRLLDAVPEALKVTFFKCSVAVGEMLESDVVNDHGELRTVCL